MYFRVLSGCLGKTGLGVNEGAFGFFYICLTSVNWCGSGLVKTGRVKGMGCGLMVLDWV